MVFFYSESADAYTPVENIEHDNRKAGNGLESAFYDAQISQLVKLSI